MRDGLPSAILRLWTDRELYTKILIGLVLGAVAGLVFGEPMARIKPLGDLFIRLITMLVVPLIFASLFVGTASLGDLKKLGRIGGKTILYYLCTTAIALTIGLLLANLIRPGARLDPAVQATMLEEFGGAAQQNIERYLEKPSIMDTVLGIVPPNPLEALAEGDFLQIIFFALLLGVAATYLRPDRREPLVRFFEGVNDAMIELVHLVMKIAPYGVFALIAAVVGQFGLEILMALIRYSLVVFIGLILHVSLVYTGAVGLLGRMRPSKFFRGIRPAQLIAFSTSSSSATLPVSMEVAQRELGVSEEISSFVLPLGATINMDGTALYQGVAAFFIAEVYGLDLTLGQQLTVVLTATLASIGAAGVPGIGIITLAMVLQAINVPLEGIALILGVDRILDMLRTTVNITGDLSASVVVAASEGELTERPAGGS